MPKSFGDLFREAESREEYWVADAIHGFTEDLVEAMETQRVSRTQLAAKLGASPAYVTKILRGNANFTLRSMVRIARSLGLALRARLVPPEAALIAPFQPERRFTLTSTSTSAGSATGFAGIVVAAQPCRAQRAVDSGATTDARVA